MRRAIAVAGAALLVALPAGARSQEAPAPGPEPTSRPALEGVHVGTRARGTLVATVVAVPAGSASDPEAAPGAAYLLGEVLAESARRRLGAGAAVDVRVEREWTAFTLLAAPDTWRESLSTLAATLFRESVPGALVTPVRAGLLARFTFESGAPVREFERELYGLLTSTSHPWARPPRGLAEAIRTLDASSLVAFRRAHYDRGLARAAVVGPMPAVEARAAVAAAGLGGRSGSSSREDGGRAWSGGDRMLLERDVTNAWVGVAFPAPRDASRTLLEALAHRIHEALNPATPDPGIFAASARVEDTPGGPVVLVEAAVFPEAAGEWERRILEVVDRIEDPAEAAFFRWQRRRFRSHRLLEESAPEVEALRAALDLLREGRVRDLPAEIWALSAGAVADLADDLGEPRILVLGPDLTEGQR